MLKLHPSDITNMDNLSIANISCRLAQHTDKGKVTSSKAEYPLIDIIRDTSGETMVQIIYNECLLWYELPLGRDIIYLIP